MPRAPKTDTASPADPTPSRTHAPVEPLPMTSPIWATLYQTATRNVWETFTGPGAQGRAEDHAEDVAQTTNRIVVVFGPQHAIFAPTPPVVPKATKLALVDEPDAAGVVM